MELFLLRAWLVHQEVSDPKWSMMIYDCINADYIRSIGLHVSAARHAITKFYMPAMSPTMTEGGLATWKVKEGQSFAAGDVLLEIETDKATMDVEAQEDGIMAKIVVQEGAKAVPVGKTIAMLAEEGDDISNVEVPAEESSSSAPQKEESSSNSAPSTAPSAPAEDPQKKKTNQESPAGSPQHSASHAPNIGRQLFPSVSRLLIENNVSAADAKSIKGTGLHGMLTKGDVLAYLGKVSNPNGSYKPSKGGIAALGAPFSGQSSASAQKKQSSEPLTDDAVRNLILRGLASSSHAARSKELASKTVKSKDSFDEFLNDYEFGSKTKKTTDSFKKVDSLKGLL